MGFSYRPLWIMLAAKELSKEQLREGISASSSTVAKMGKNEYVSMEVLDKICTFLECKIEDVIEHIPEADNLKSKIK